MEYNDEPILSLHDYEIMAKEYTSSLKNKGFIFVQVDNEEMNQLVEETFNYMSKSKSCLFMMGGFLNTSSFYSLNERQLKKMRILFDFEKPLKSFKLRPDKTTCFLKFIGLESRILKNLMILSERCNYEREIKQICQDRLTTLSNIFLDD